MEIFTLPADTELSCGCDARKEPGGSQWSWRDGFKTSPHPTEPDIRGERVMVRQADGTVRHFRCGNVSEPVAPKPFTAINDPEHWRLNELE